MTNKIRQRYAYLSGVIRRKLRKLEARMPESIMLERYSGEFRPLKELGPVSDRALQRGIKEAERLLESKELSLKTRKRAMGAAIKTLNSRGYDYINSGNFKYFFDFLEDARSRGLASIYGYQYLLDTFNRAKKRGLSDEEIKGNIAYWAEQYETRREQADRRGLPEDMIKNPKLYVRKGRYVDEKGKYTSSESFQRSKKSNKRR